MSLSPWSPSTCGLKPSRMFGSSETEKTTITPDTSGAAFLLALFLLLLAIAAVLANIDVKLGRIASAIEASAIEHPPQGEP